MKFEDIYNKAISNNLSVNMLDNFMKNNPIEFKRNNRFLDIYNLLNVFRDNNRNELIDCFFSNLNRINEVFDRIFRFMFLEKYRTLDTLWKILKVDYVLPYDSFVILLDELTSFYNDRYLYEDIFIQYYEVIKERNVDDYLNGICFEYISSHDLYQLYRDNPMQFKSNIIDFFKNNPNRKIYFDRFDKNIYKEFKEYSDRIFWNELSYEDINYINDILKDKYGYTRGFKLSQDVYKMVWDYYKESHDSRISLRVVSFLKNNLLDCFTLDYENTNIEEVSIPYSAFRYLNELIDKVNKSNSKVRFVINYRDADNHYNDLLLVEDKDKVLIDFQGLDNDGKVTLTNYIKSHEFYDATAVLINKIATSPLEKYIYAYYLTTILKKYRYYRDDEKIDSRYHNMSRNEYYIVYGDYIVCAGYVNFLVNLLNRVGIKSSFLVISPPEVEDFHARSLTHIVDSKYGIDGVYIGDPTFDSGNGVSFRHAFLTKNKESYDRYQKNDDSSLDFYEAMSSLALSDRQCDYRNKEFFDMVDNNIPDDVKIEALRTIISNLHPDYSLEQLDYVLQEIALESGFLYLSDDVLKERVDSFKDFSSLGRMIDIPGLKFNWLFNKSYNDSYSSISFSLEIDEYDDLNLYNILSSMKLDNINILFDNKVIIEFNLTSYSKMKDIIDSINSFMEIIKKKFNLHDKSNSKELVPSSDNSLYSLIIKNNKIAIAILSMDSVSREKMIINMFINKEISTSDLAILFKYNITNRDVFLETCGISEESNIIKL